MKKILPKNLEAFFLDFDGVVVESTDIKTQAFYEVYLSYGQEIAIKAREYHIHNQGINRSIKFREIHKKYLEYILTEKESIELSNNFSSIVLEKILNCPLVEGIEAFLIQQQNKDVPVFLLSATPHDELIKIVKMRNLYSYFKEVYGAPKTKVEEGKEILRAHHLNANNIVFIGDAVSDYEAAVTLGTLFIGRILRDEPSPFSSDVPCIFSFNEMLCTK